MGIEPEKRACVDIVGQTWERNAGREHGGSLGAGEPFGEAGLWQGLAHRGAGMRLGGEDDSGHKGNFIGLC